jgi:hypothetical protein
LAVAVAVMVARSVAAVVVVAVAVTTVAVASGSPREKYIGIAIIGNLLQLLILILQICHFIY